ncbi:hypothetical protein KIW84_051968 [Lathyrus oleraceus]|uniref:DUF7906 domain-containing protein n=1 Tax=Pisum sativum TaxID=3888 RepID=A0A9D5ABC7_PEA|nr:hypothetical protein KIW84_051968 [Pisum sativum]
MRTQKVDGSLALEVWLGFNLLLQQGFKTGCETDVVLQSGGIGLVTCCRLELWRKMFDSWSCHSFFNILRSFRKWRGIGTLFTIWATNIACCINSKIDSQSSKAKLVLLRICFEVVSSVSRALDTNRNRLGTSADGGGATQVWLSSGRFVVIDLSAGPCTYGKIEAEEGSVSSRTLPRLRNAVRLSTTASYRSSNDIFLGPLASLVSTTVEHVIAPGPQLQYKHRRNQGRGEKIAS